jgi:predicted ATPase
MRLAVKGLAVWLAVKRLTVWLAERPSARKVRSVVLVKGESGISKEIINALIRTYNAEQMTRRNELPNRKCSKLYSENMYEPYYYA